MLIAVGMEGYACSIDPSGDEDYFSFDAIQGYGYTVRFEDENGIDVDFALYDHDHNHIGSSSTQVSYICNVTGTNYIRVMRDGGANTGNYIIRVLPAS